MSNETTTLILRKRTIVEVEFTDGKRRTFRVDGYEQDGLMVHLWIRSGPDLDSERKVIHIIPSMLIRVMNLSET